MKSFGRINYDGYCATMGGKNPRTGETLVCWEALSDLERTSWESGAQAAIEGETALVGNLPSSSGG